MGRDELFLSKVASSIKNWQGRISTVVQQNIKEMAETQFNCTAAVL